MRRKVKSNLYTVCAVLIALSLAMVFSPEAAAASLSVDKTTMQPGDTVTATYSVTWKENEGGFVGFYSKDADDGHWITYKKLDFNLNTLTLSDPHFSVQVDNPGSYEFRLFTDYFGTKKVATVSVEVVYMPTSTVTASPSSVFPGDKITATYTISAIDGKDTSGWVAFFRKGQEDKGHLSYQNTGGRSGTFEVIAPDSPGEYEFILYKDYFGYYKLATSGVVTIKEKDTREVSDAHFTSITGEVGISSDPENVEWTPCTPKTVIHVGDHISTGRDSSCKLTFRDMTDFTMKPETEVIVNPEPAQETKLGLVLGHLWVNTKKMLTNGTMEVEMGQAVTGIKGTTFVCEEDGAKSTLKVLEGVVELTAKSGGSAAVVGSGEMITADANGLGPKQTFDLAAECVNWGMEESEAIPHKEKVIVLEIGSPMMTVDAVEKEFESGKGTAPVFSDWQIMLPIQAIVEELGGTVERVDCGDKVVLTLHSDTIEMWIGKTAYTVDGVEKRMDAAPRIIDGAVMTPIQFAMDNLGGSVVWDADAKKVYITYAF